MKVLRGPGQNVHGHRCNSIPKLSPAPSLSLSLVLHFKCFITQERWGGEGMVGSHGTVVVVVVMGGWGRGGGVGWPCVRGRATSIKAN